MDTNRSKYHLIAIGMEPNDPLAYVPVMEYHLPNMSMIGGYGGRSERKREKERNDECLFCVSSAIETALKLLINGNTNFEDFVAQIKDNQEVVATQKPYTTGKILSITYTLVFKVVLYPLE